MRRQFLFPVWGIVLALSFVQPFASSSSYGLDLDWTGSFRAESHFLLNYGMGTGTGYDATRDSADGYYIPGGGSRNTYFQTLFLKLRPSIIVNDNIFIKSELWAGNPVYGFFGDAFPNTRDQRQYYSTQSRGSTFTAQRYWAELLTRVGTVQLGRAPLHYGLGLVWNSGDGIWDRYESTGDLARLVSKFGAFTFAPAFVKYSMGNNVGGACPKPTQTNSGGVATPGEPCSRVIEGMSKVEEYSMMFKYDNREEDIELGMNFIRRLASRQDEDWGLLGIEGTQAGSQFNLWDIYASKRFGGFTFAAEAPIGTGDIGGIRYKAFAAGTNTTWKISEAWETGLKAGYVSGQADIDGSRPDEYTAFYFHPNYKIAHILFNYNPRAFAGPNTKNNPGVNDTYLLSPFDNPITNATYASLNGAYRLQKWRFNLGLVYARALQTAQSTSNRFFNSWEKKFVRVDENNIQKSGTKSGLVGSQGKELGFEIDHTTTFFWDDSFEFSADLGVLFPGSYYKFSNTDVENKTLPIFITAFRAGILF